MKEAESRHNGKHINYRVKTPPWKTKWPTWHILIRHIQGIPREKKYNEPRKWQKPKVKATIERRNFVWACSKYKYHDKNIVKSGITVT